MTGGTCRTPDCGAIVADAFVCSTCAHRLRVALDDVRDLLADLDVDLTRQARTGHRIGGRSVDRPLPFDLGASVARDILTSTLRTWCLVLAGDLLAEAPADDALAARLLDLLDDVRQRTDGGQIVDEVTAAVTAARAHLLRADRAPTILAGHCPECGTPLYAPDGAATARCRTPDCDGVVDVGAWRQAAREGLRAAVLPLAEVHQALTVLGRPTPLGTLKSWVHRERLLPCWATDDTRQRPLYLVEDALGLTSTRKEAS